MFNLQEMVVNLIVNRNMGSRSVFISIKRKYMINLAILFENIISKIIPTFVSIVIWTS